MTIVNAVEVAASTKKNNGETLINIVLDETGSMNSCWDATISSFNDYIGGQKSQDGVCRVTMTMFSSVAGWNFGSNTEITDIRNLYSNKLVEQVELLSRSNYRPSGGTNLYDAIGTSIRGIEAQLEGQDEVPNVLMVIITDGDENSSKEFRLSDIQNMVKAKEAEGWTFVYLGANQDAWKVGQAFGLAQGQTMTYSTSNMEAVSKSLGVATATYRSTRFADASLASTVETNFFAPADDSDKE